MRDALSDVSLTFTKPEPRLMLSEGRVHHQAVRTHRHRQREVQEALAQGGILIR